VRDNVSGEGMGVTLNVSIIVWYKVLGEERGGGSHCM